MFMTQYLCVKINRTREKNYLVVSARNTALYCAALSCPVVFDALQLHGL